MSAEAFAIVVTFSTQKAVLLKTAFLLKDYYCMTVNLKTATIHSAGAYTHKRHENS